MVLTLLIGCVGPREALLRSVEVDQATLRWDGVRIALEGGYQLILWPELEIHTTEGDTHILNVDMRNPSLGMAVEVVAGAWEAELDFSETGPLPGDELLGYYWGARAGATGGIWGAEVGTYKKTNGLSFTVRPDTLGAGAGAAAEYLKVSIDERDGWLDNDPIGEWEDEIWGADPEPSDTGDTADTGL